MDIKSITEEDLDDLVQVHCSAFQDFFLTDLGPKFLNFYYRSVLKSSNGILIGVFNNDYLVGFCAACTKSTGFNKSLIKSNWFGYGLIGCQLLLTKPKALVRLIKNFTKRDESVEDSTEYAELMSIAVAEEAQNIGVGKLLEIALESELKKKGVKRLSLTTDKEKNEKTLAFYSNRGFKEFYSFKAYPNRPMYRLIKDII